MLPSTQFWTDRQTIRADVLITLPTGLRQPEVRAGRSGWLLPRA